LSFSAGTKSDTPAGGLDRITGREREILVLLAHGQPNADIARMLHMSEGTVKGNARRVMAKLAVAVRVQAALIAHHSGLLDGEYDPTAP